jgi:hypothetical protein
MLVYVRPSNEALLRARVPGAQDQYGCPSHLSDCAASESKKDGLATPSPLQARSLSLQGWGLIDLPLRATFSPAHPLADIFHPPYPPIASQSISRDVPLARARATCFLLCTVTPSRPRESPDCPSLRASDEHRFIVRVLRARRMVWRLPIPPFSGRALREHRRSSGSIPSSAGAVGGRKFCCLNGAATYGGLETVCENPAHQGFFH